MKSLIRVGLACSLSFMSCTALATGSGTIDDATLSLDYTGGPFAVPFAVTEVASLAGIPPPCIVSSVDLPVCDFYALKMDLSEELRKHPDSAKARVDIVLSSAGEYDFFLYDSSGELVGEPDHVATPETLSLSIKSLPNGDYTIVIVPWLPMAETFDLNIAAVGTGKPAKSGLEQVLGGALSPLLLLPLLLAGLPSRARRYSQD